MDIGQIGAAVSSLKVAGEIAVGLVNLKTMAEVQAKAIELNQKILAAQYALFDANAAQTTLIQRVSELEKQIASMEAWETQKQRYKMTSPFNGCTVYALQKSMSEGEPPHYICANCYQNRKPSILQNGTSTSKEGGSWGLLVCPVCKAECRTGYRPGSGRKYAEDIQNPE